MADRTFDPRLETLLRNVLAAEVANLPLTVRPDQVLKRAETRRRARARSRLRRVVFGDPTGGVRQLSVAMGAMAVLVMAGALAIAALRLDRISVAAPLPTTADVWSRVAIGTGVGGSVESVVVTPLGLLALGDEDGGHWMAFSVDGRTWTTVAPDQIPDFGEPPYGISGAAVAGDDERFLMVGRGAWASEDGITWGPVATPTDDPELGQGAVLAVARGGPGFVAVGAHNTAWFSTDGSDWALADVPPEPSEPSVLGRWLDRTQPQGTVQMERIAVSGRTLLAWGKSIWVHKDGSATFVPVFWTSTDGLTWTNQEPPSPTWDYPNVTGGPNGFLVTSERGAVWLSTDGASWERVAGNQFTASGAAAQTFSHPMAAGSAGYVAVGSVFEVPDPACWVGCPFDEAVVWTSPDGRSWTRSPSDERFGGASSDEHAGAKVVAAWGDRFIVGGSYGDEPAIWISK